MMKYSKLLKIFLIFFLSNNSFSSDYSMVRYSAWEKADVDLLYVLQKIKMLYWWRRTLKKMIIHILLRLEWHLTLEKSLKIKAFG